MRRRRKAPVEGAAETPVEAGVAEGSTPDAASEIAVVDPGASPTEGDGRDEATYQKPRRRPRRPRAKAASAEVDAGAAAEDGAAVEAVAAPVEEAPREPADTRELAPVAEAPQLFTEAAPEAASAGEGDGTVTEEAPKTARRPRRPRGGGRSRRRGEGDAPAGEGPAAAAAPEMGEPIAATRVEAGEAPAEAPSPAKLAPAAEAEWAPADQQPPLPLDEAPEVAVAEEPVAEELPFERPASAALAEAEGNGAAPVDEVVVVSESEFPREDELPPTPEDGAPPEEPVTVYMRPRRERGRRRRGDRDRDRSERPAEEPVVAQPAPAAEAAPARAERERERDRDRERERERDRERAPVAAERLNKEIIVNVDPRETRIAVIENNRLVELHVEREERVVGSIYKGRVANVLPGMDAAFVEIGLERNAFLYVGDILYETGEENGVTQHRRAGREMKIRDVAKTGQEILVQVVKGPRGTKGARVSTKMSLPGRYIVLMPDADNLGVSRKIEEADERERLKKIGEAVRPNGFGMIIRTEAEGKTEHDLRQDMELLVKQWRQIQEKAKRTPPPGLVHQDLSLLLKTIRDVFGSDVDRLLMDSPSDFRKVQELLEALSPKLVSRVELYQGAEPIFHKFGLDQEIERLLRRKVWLKSGGYISIDSTEALTAIDVNTGKFIGTTSLSDTILKTNLDAVTEISRQLRLRDIGGMIIIDFIDMSSARDRAQVMAALDKALKKDRTRTKVAHISPLGLVEMTRKRTGETVTDLLTDSCPYCQGRGRVSSAESISIHIAREIKRRCAQNDVDAILVHTSPDVAAYLIGPEGDNVEALEKEIRRPIYVRARHDFHVEKYEVLPGDMLEIEQQLMPYRGGQVVECQVQKMELIAAPRSAAWVDGYFVDLANGTRFQGQKARVRLTDVRRSFALGEPVPPASALDKSEPI